MLPVPSEACMHVYARAGVPPAKMAQLPSSVQQDVIARYLARPLQLYMAPNLSAAEGVSYITPKGEVKLSVAMFHGGATCCIVDEAVADRGRVAYVCLPPCA